MPSFDGARAGQAAAVQNRTLVPNCQGSRGPALGVILLIVLLIFLIGGFSGRIGGYGYGFGHGGVGVIGTVLVVVLVLTLLGRI